LKSLIALLVDSGVILPVTSTDLGLDGEAPIPSAQQPAPFSRVLRYVCELLETPEPPCCAHPVLLGDARMAHMQPSALLCGSTLLEQPDSVDLGFRLVAPWRWLRREGSPDRCVRAASCAPMSWPHLLLPAARCALKDQPLRAREMPSPLSMHLLARPSWKVSQQTGAQVWLAQLDGMAKGLAAWPHACRW